jgi:hypothetical protein
MVPQGSSEGFIPVLSNRRRGPFLPTERKLQKEKGARGNLFKQKKTRYDEKSVTKFSSLKIEERRKKYERGRAKAKFSCLVSFFAIRLFWDLNPQCCLLEAMVKCYRGLGWGCPKRRRETKEW